MNSKKALFYVDPWNEMGRHDFRLGAVKNTFGPIATILAKNGYEIALISNEYVRDTARRELMMGRGARYFSPSLNALSKTARNYKDFSRRYATKAVADADLESIRVLFADMNPFNGESPDLIFIWESATGFMQALFPSALVVNLMPGLFSRAPMPNMISLDVQGFFADSMLGSGAWPELSKDLLPRQADKYRAMASVYFDDFLLSVSPILRHDLDPEGQFRKLVLLPLQISNYFAFNDTSNYESQYDFMIDVLRHAPHDVGVVVTQYVSKFIEDRVIHEGNEAYLKDAYPNLIYQNKFDQIDSISQMLLPSVDAVVSVSSSIGLQAALCDKPVFSPSRSHLSALNEQSGLANFFAALRAPSVAQANVDRDAIIATVMTHLHFLKSDTIENEEWLMPALERAVLEKRAGAAPAFIQKCFAKAGDSYLNKFNLDHSSKKRFVDLLDRSGFPLPRLASARADEMEKSIRDENIRLVSFDIFDTLVQRTIERPVDVFAMIEDDVRRASLGKIQNFGKTRYLAERIARERKKRTNAESNEVTLAEIYQVFAQGGDLDEACIRSIMALEMRAEKRVLIAKQDGLRLFRLAKSLGKRVILISDMYLPKSFLQEVLTDLGIDGYQDFYLSCDFDVRKHDGRLFDLVAEREAISDMKSWLHVGDNEVSDIKMASARGIRTLLLSRGPDKLMKSTKYASLYLDTRGDRTLWDSIQLGLIAKEFHADVAQNVLHDTHFSKQPRQLGYSGMGPLLAGFSIWLAREAKTNNISDLYFLARDGDIMKRVYDIIGPTIAPGVRTHYIYSSRRAAQVSGIDGAEAIMRMCNTQFHGGTVELFMQEKFGLSADELDPAVLEQHGLKRDMRITKKDLTGRVLDFCLSITDAILRNSQRERSAYLDYLNEHGVIEARRPGLVDIGYAGSMQQALSHMLQRDEIHGFYFMSFAKAGAVHASGNPVHSYFGEFVETKTHNHPITRLGLCFEMLFTNCDGSLVRFDRNLDGTVSPVLDKSAIEPVRQTLLPIVRAGACSFARDLVSHFKDVLPGIGFDPQATLRIFIDFLDRPSGRDAEMLEGWKFEDAFSGAGVRYAVPPRSLIQKNPQIVDKAVWKAGASVFSRRPDLFKNESTSQPLKASKAPPASDPEKKTLEKKKSILVRFLAKRLGEKKLAKLMRDPEAFFMDSKNVIARHFGVRLWPAFKIISKA